MIVTATGESLTKSQLPRMNTLCARHNVLERTSRSLTGHHLRFSFLAVQSAAADESQRASSALRISCERSSRIRAIVASARSFTICCCSALIARAWRDAELILSKINDSIDLSLQFCRYCQISEELMGRAYAQGFPVFFARGCGTYC